MAKKIKIYDTTLRDGSQGEGVNFSLEDKIRMTKQLDELGIAYVEGGWPGSNPKDVTYFEKIKDLKLKNIKVASFGSTRHAKNTAENDPNLNKLIEAKTSVITIFGKAWDLHVKEALRVSYEENLDMIYSSISFLKKNTEQVFFDAEHFFDGFFANQEYTLSVIKTALDAGAEIISLCETNGGRLPHEIRYACEVVTREFPEAIIGIHCHNDCGLGVANSIEAVRAGAKLVQGCINGFGERTGNADLCAIIPVLQLKLGYSCIADEKLKELTKTSNYAYELANLLPRDHQPFVGKSAFAHKGGIHVSAIARNPDTYEHIRPEEVGNERRILVSELAGKSNILAFSPVDLSKQPEKMRKILEKIMALENAGYAFENATASLELLIQKITGDYLPAFQLEGFRVISENRNEDERVSEASVKIKVGKLDFHTVAEGDHGPVSAIDLALRKALINVFPYISDIRLIDYRVHIVNSQDSTDAKVRVIIESQVGRTKWSTIGVSENILEASCLALIDSYQYMIQKEKHKE